MPKPAGKAAASPATLPLPKRPIVTLMSDFGNSDFYVSAMKAALLKGSPDVRMIDVTHEIPRHDILCGSITLERSVDGFPPGTIHLAVIDPGVGTDRRILVAEVNGQRIVCPDNGLITWSYRRHPGMATYELTWRPKDKSKVSNTFHGRDIMAPAVGMLACGAKIESIAKKIDDPVLLDVAPVAPPVTSGRVIHVDVFGNATTNFSHDVIKQLVARKVQINGRDLGRIRKTYWDVAPGKPLALIGSSGLLEIAVRDGSAAENLQVKVGDEVTVG